MLTKDTGIIDAVQNHPEILEVFAESCLPDCRQGRLSVFCGQ